MLYRGEEVKLSISCPWLFLENQGTVYIYETAAYTRHSVPSCCNIVFRGSWRQGSKQVMTSESPPSGVKCEWRGHKAMAEMAIIQIPEAQTLFLSHSLLASISIDWRSRVGTAWAVFQGGFSDVFETIIASHFLYLRCLLQLPSAETLCSVQT